MADAPRLIEVAFPLKQVSLDSVHEKNVRHGHISTLHIWPARRPLAACRAALIATLLPDPGTPDERRRLLEKLAGKVVQVHKSRKLPGGKVEERLAEETIGGILRWGRESSRDLDWFREKIRDAYGGRAPRVLDPFAGGGAIPLEAVRLGCEATAVDINPVAWFILKCTLEYPQRLAGQKLPLPAFVLKDRAFMESFFKAQGLKGAAVSSRLQKLGLGQVGTPELGGWEMGEDPDLRADLAWHVRAWGSWVLNETKRELARFYPTYAEFEPLSKDSSLQPTRELKQVPLKPDGTPDVERMNAEFGEEYLRDPRNPRWVPKPTVAYLWARTVICKNCRAAVPLLKTRWLCKKDDKRVVLTMESNAQRTGVIFGVQTGVPRVGGNAAQQREHDKRVGAGTMSRSGATCPCCGAIMTMEDIRLEGKAGRLGAMMTTVVMDGLRGKEYRLPTDREVRAAGAAEDEIDRVFDGIPFGVPEEPLPGKEALGFRVPLYGFDQWRKLFTPRQLLTLGVFVKHTRLARRAMSAEGYSPEWVEALGGYLALAVDRLADRGSAICSWTVSWDKIRNTFTRFALPMTWDFAEGVGVADSSGGYPGAIDWIAMYVAHACAACAHAPRPDTCQASATRESGSSVDLIVTDPPYYDAIPYSDLMDFFYVWLRRTLHGLSPGIDAAFRESLGPKWDHERNDGELIDDASRFRGDRARSRAAYEEGMFRAFRACHQALEPQGRLVVVFAHKQPDAWETLASAIIRAGFVVKASWPIQTEMGNRTRALSSAALSSSVWLVCRKRPENTGPGWDNHVLEEMRAKIATRLREFWDAGIRGPDFVWAATGPALEAYSKHPVVKKANEPGRTMAVPEFLRHVRRFVADFVVGRVLSHNGGGRAPSELDDVTTYYLLHRHDFGMEDAPIGACILYAVSCGISDTALVDQFDVLLRGSGRETPEENGQDTESEDTDAGLEEGTGSTVRLKPWYQRRRKNMGYGAPGGRSVPLIDQIHRLMHLWKSGDVVKVNEYLDDRGLRRNTLFHQLLQALIELAPAGSEERSLLESISNHLATRGVAAGGQARLPAGWEEAEQ